MKKVLIIGGGLAGCVAAGELSRAGIACCIVEKDADLGGKARRYGCKATDVCNNCGVCLTGSLWEKTRSDGKIELLFSSRLVDLHRETDGFTAVIDTPDGRVFLPFRDVLVTSGFDFLPEGDSANLELISSDRVITGPALERMLRTRGDALFPQAPERVGFLLCFGSRSTLLGAPYCSRVCCPYSTRAAKVIRHLYPACEVVLFCMDIQAVKPGQYEKELREDGITLIRRRPASVALVEQKPSVAWGEEGGLRTLAFDYLVLSSGIRPGSDTGLLAELCSLQTDENGFLHPALPPEETGVWVAGTVSGPMTIAETAADAKRTAALMIAAAREVAAL